MNKTRSRKSRDTVPLNDDITVILILVYFKKQSKALWFSLKHIDTAF
jgi:hypothetical protein